MTEPRYYYAHGLAGEHWVCPKCGPHVAVDEDGCCVTCEIECAANLCQCEIASDGRPITRSNFTRLRWRVPEPEVTDAHPRVPHPLPSRRGTGVSRLTVAWIAITAFWIGISLGTVVGAGLAGGVSVTRQSATDWSPSTPAPATVPSDAGEGYEGR